VSILLDTGVLYAYYDRSDSWHARVGALVRSHAGGLLVPAPVIPEVDHLIGHRLGARARQVFYQGLSDGAYLIVDLPHDRYDDVGAVDRRFQDLELGFVDAAIVVLAGVTGVRRIATSDRRDFEPVAKAYGLELLP
jgi:predicted nucleic acid-binding protein